MRKNKFIALSSAVIMAFSVIAQPVLFNTTTVEASYNITIVVPSTSSFLPSHHGKVESFGNCGSDTLEYYLYEDGALYIRNTDHSGADTSLVQIPVGDDFAWKDYATSLYIEAGVYGISEGVFVDCDKLTSITYSADSLVVPKGEFTGCKALQNVTSKDTVFPYKPETFPDELSVNYYAYDKVELTIQDTVLKEFSISSYRGSAPDEVTLPFGITQVADNAIKDERGITTLTFPESVTKIGAGNMNGCVLLETINFPASLNYIGGKICEDTKWLAKQYETGNFAIVNNILVGTNADAKDGNIPDGVKEIASEVFKGITITSLTIPSSVKKINDGAFESCHTLGEISFLEGLEEIGDYAFYGCAMAEVNLPDSLKTIGKSAFEMCTSLERVNKPDTLEYAAPDAFSFTPWIHKFDISTKVVNGVLIGYGEIGNTINVPENVVSMEAGFVCSDDDLVNIVIPDSVRYIREDTVYLEQDNRKTNVLFNANPGSYAFDFAKEQDVLCCRNSKSLDFGNLGLVVKYGYFPNGTGWILFENNILYIYTDSIKTPDTGANKTVEAFKISDFDSENGNLLDRVETVWIEDGVSAIEKDALNFFTNMKVLRIPDSVNSIEEQNISIDFSSFIVTGSSESMAKSFSETLGCYFIDSNIGFDFTAHRTIKAVVPCGEDMYFIRYFDWAMLVYGNGKMYDGWSEVVSGQMHYFSQFFKNYDPDKDADDLYDSEKQKVVYIDPSVKYIGENGLQDLHGYTVKYISPNITHFGIRACYGLDFDVPVVLNKDVDYWGAASFAYTGVKSFDASNIYCSALPTSCFGYAAELTDLKLPKGLTEIGNYALCKTPFGEFEIPDCVTKIGDYAFEECPNLKSITMPSALISVGEAAFYNCKSLTNVDFGKAKDVEKVGRICFEETPYFENAFARNPLVINGCVLLDGHYVKDVVNIPEGVTVIADSAFSFMHPNQHSIVEDLEATNAEYAINEITFPSTLKYIGDYAFFYRWGVGFNYLELPEKLCTIGKYAFNYCTVAESEIPSSVYDIGYKAFSNDLENAWLYEMHNKTLIDVPVEELKGTSFSNHFLLDTMWGSADWHGRDVVFPSNTGISAIAGGALTGDIRRLTLPSSVTIISSEAFYNLKNLQKLTVYGDVTYIGEDLFPKNNHIQTICAKKGSLFEKYALENGLEFIPLDENAPYPNESGSTTGTISGDLDGDLKVTLMDAKLVLKASLGIEKITEEQKTAADVDKDSKVTLNDAKQVLKYSLGIITSFEIKK